MSSVTDVERHTANISAVFSTWHAAGTRDARFQAFDAMQFRSSLFWVVASVESFVTDVLGWISVPFSRDKGLDNFTPRLMAANSHVSISTSLLHRWQTVYSCKLQPPHINVNHGYLNTTEFQKRFGLFHVVS